MPGKIISPFDLWFPLVVSRPNDTVLIDPRESSSGSGNNVPFTETPPSGNQPLASAAPAVVMLPRNTSVPETAEAVDFQRVVKVEPDTELEDLLFFDAQQGGITVLTHYALFTDAFAAGEIEFRPTVDGNRVLSRHGNPSLGGLIKYPTGSDLTNNSLREGMITLQPGQRFSWKVTNASGSILTMGVRVKGYYQAI